jgi:hypothetical protein
MTDVKVHHLMDATFGRRRRLAEPPESANRVAYIICLIYTLGSVP